MKEEPLRSFHEKEALRYARVHFSPYIYVSDINEKSSEARLGLIIQDGIADHKTDDFRIRTINLSDIGTLHWNRSPRGKTRFRGPNRTDLIKRTRHLYSSIIQRSQRLLLNSLYTKLVTIDMVSVAMTPFKKILISLEDSEKHIVSVSNLGRQLSQKRRSRTHQYFNVLRELGYIEKVENGKYTVGEAMSNLKVGKMGSTELYGMILADVIQKRAKYLQEVLHLTMIVPFLRWSNSYYFPAYEAGSLVSMDNEKLFANCQSFYNIKPDKDAAKSQIQSIVETNILTRDSSGYYRGIEDIFEEYSSNADKQGILEPIQAT